MVLEFYTFDLLTGRRIQKLPALSGSWDVKLNDAGSVDCTVSLRDPAVKRLDLLESAVPTKTALAAVDGDTVLQAGPILEHSLNGDTQELTLTAAGLLAYLDMRRLLPPLAGRLPTDPTTDTRFSPISVDPDNLWPTDTRSSLQGIMVTVLAQMLSHTGGNIPLVLPAAIPGDSERWYRGSDVAPVGRRVRELAGVIGGPDFRFTPRWRTDKTGFEWVAEIGTPTQPMLFGAIKPVFNMGVDKSSITNVSIDVSGSNLVSQGYAIGGRSSDEALITVSSSAQLLAAGFPLTEDVDSSHNTVQEQSTLQAYSDELVAAGRKPLQSWSFSHDFTVRPYLGSFSVGDFAEVRVTSNSYLRTDNYTMRILAMGGSFSDTKIKLTFQPEVL